MHILIIFINESEKILRQHRLADPALYQLVEEQHAMAKNIAIAEKKKPDILVKAIIPEVSVKEPLPEPLYFKQIAQKTLKAKISASHQSIHAYHVATGAMIVPRTSARNAKQPHTTIEEACADRSEKVSAQIQAWRSLIPTIIASFAKIRDPRRAKSVKHTLYCTFALWIICFYFPLELTT